MKKIKNNKVLGGLLVACFICASTLNANANTLGDNSGYKLTEKATASSNTITILNYDRSLNTLNPKYYDLNLTTTTYGSGSNSKKINVTLPNNKTTTITAKYGTGDYVGKSSTTAGGAINITNRTHKGTITGNFINNTSTANAAAIYVYGDSSITGGINANFIGNTVNSTSIVTGAAITLDSADGAGGVTGNIGNISGVFISNSVSGDLGASGGAIQIAKGYENGNTNIIANFINNSVNSANANACGGAIDFFGDLKNITGDFIGNHANSNATYKDGYLRDAYGGAIFSYGGSVGNITGDFIGNYAKTTNTTNATGGAISFRFLVERTGTISGDFIQNYVDSNVDAFGGFLYNYGGNIGDIIGNFNGNYAKGKKNAYGGAIANSFYGNSYKNKINSVQGTFAGNYTTAASSSFGGAIYNTGTLDIKNASFYSNHADSTGSKAKGGAIYNTGNNAKLTITADNYNSEFIGNYVNNNGTKTNNAIYTDAAITMKAINNGSILLDDKITGTSGYGLTFTGDNTGRIFLNNTIGSPKITANKVTLDMQNNNYQAYSWNTLSADKTVKFEIDSDLKAGKTDTITISTAPSTQSYVNISDLGWNDNLTFTDSDLNKKLQILTTPSNKIQLSLDNAITSKQYKYGQRIHNYDNIVTTVNSNETFYDISDTYDLYGNVKLAQTSTTNDSITFVANSSLDTLVNTEKTAHTDTLATLNRYVTSDDKVFNIVTGSYNVKENLGETIGNITINNNTLNLGGFSGFELSNSSTLNLNNVKLTGNSTLATISNENAIINLNNAFLDGNIDANNSFAINFSGDKNTINGTVQNANATLNSGELVFNTDSFKGNNNSLTVNNGTVNLITNNFENYEFNKLVTNGGSFKLDFNAQTGEVDTISTGNNSNGLITLDGFNILGSFPYTSEFGPIQILKAQDDSIKLALSDAINTNAPFAIGTTKEIKDDIITSSVNFDHIFKRYYRDGITYGTIKLATTNTTNDSIELKVDNSIPITWTTDYLYLENMGDTLNLLNTKNNDLNKNFNFSSENDIYTSKANVGIATNSSVLNINGISNGNNKSTINLNGFSGFELSNSSTLNLNNVKLTGNQTVVSVSNPNTIINLNNAFLDGNINANNSFAMNFSGDKNTINGTVQNANATLNSGELVFNTDTFANATLNAVNGSISLANSKLKTYNFNVLNASETKFSIDIDLSNEKSDVLNVGTNSTGNVLIDSINFFNPDTPTKEFIVKVINGDSNNIGLQLSNSVQDNEYKIGTTTKVTNNINSNVTFGETFKEYTTNGDLYGKLEVATSDAKNDSIKLTYNKTIWGETIEKELKDSLAGLGKLDTTEDKNFNFTSKDDTYIATENFGEVSEGTLNINGVNGSTIDGNNKDLFELNNKTEININDVVINNANSVITGTNPDVIINIKDSEISGNKNGITTAGDINIEGNTTIDNNGNGIIVTDNNSQINIDGSKGNIVILDKITGTSESDLNIENGNIILGNIIKDLDVNIDNATINLPTENIFQGVDTTIGNSNFNSVNNNTSSIIFDSLTLTGNINMAVDVDLANSQMDNIFSSTFNGNDFTINVSHMNMLSDTENVITKIAFANDAIKNNVTTSVKEVSYSPIWSYLVEYEKDTGYFTFTKGNGATPGSYNSFNPAITVGPVAAQMGGYLTILNSYEEAFRNMDMYMLMTKEQRQAIKYANKYASSNYNLAFNEINTPYTETSGWFRPFTTFETVGLKNGPKVNNVSYGSYAGLESNMYELGNGWDGIYSIYAGYTGSHQTYQGNSIYQNGGIFGIVGMAYKDNFFTGLTVNAGANTGEASTMYGSDDFTMFMAGVASKSGYNYEFNDGKFIIQPNFIMSYSMVNTYDFTNAAGVKINSDPLHALQLEPGIKFIGNLQNGWQPYAGVSVIWTIMDKTHFNANDVALPEMSVKPYAKYGVGVRKTWGEKLTGFFQAFVTSGGRNGVGLQTGVRYRLGNDEPKKSNSTGEKKYIKPKTKIQ